ncbi:MAG: SNF2-related protein [Flavobacteriia bacterium]|jgi:SNF2 family DNA or RNA helicase
MKFVHEFIKKFVILNSSSSVRTRVDECEVFDIQKFDNTILAVILGSLPYDVKIIYGNQKIISTSCTCPHSTSYSGLCKHSVKALFEADKLYDFQDVDPEIEQKELAKVSTIFKATSPNEENPTTENYILDNFQFSELRDSFIEHFSIATKDQFTRKKNCEIQSLEVNKGTFYNTVSFWDGEYVELDYISEEKQLKLDCTCKKFNAKMCTHMAATLYIVRNNQAIALFFDKELRREQMLVHAKDYGLEEEQDLDQYFELERKYTETFFKLKRKDLVSLNELNLEKFKQNFLPEKVSIKDTISLDLETKKGLIFSQSKYSSNFFIHFFEAKTTKEGNIKNPLKEINPINELESYEDVATIKFFTAISLFKDKYENNSSVKDKIKALKTIAKNPLGLPIYYHDTKLSENITTQSIKAIEIVLPEHSYMSFQVKENENFYEILAYIHLNGKKVNLRMVKLRYYFIFMFEMKFYLIDNPYYIKLFKFLKDKNFKLSIHESKFEQFKADFLNPIEDKVEINYTFIKKATHKQLVEKAFDTELIRTIYLEESDGYIQITPAIKYGHVEIPILSLKQINELDAAGNWFSVERDHVLENSFAGLCMRLHPDFEEQLGQFDYFYLPRRDFLESGWFIDAFEVWKNHDIDVLGFNKIKNHKLNPNKIKVSVLVSSGLDWFDTSLKVKFGNEDVSLKQVQKALKNSSRFITLDDGSEGLMPEEWIEKFSKYFRSGELVDGNIRTSKMNFSAVDELYEKEVLSQEVAEEISYLNSKIASFKTIHDVSIPKKLKGELRDYQKQGLNWLNFLDEFNFGGCLADDMGLGKTAQIIAFMLSQKEKHKDITNLIVVPTSLLFNWQREMDKFAPSLKYHCVYGANRSKSTKEFSKFDVVLTTYGTLLADIATLKDFRFHYAFLDESQAIKNPDSQRYKSVRLLQAKNRIVLTGTPIENNTFDLYAQMSFANPGLFINQNRFKEEFSTPIDKFKDIKRAKELQQKINPFILRRTKKQVAKELPEKTEMILYCEMDAEQRMVYDTYKTQIREMLLAPKNPDAPENKSMLVLKGLTKLRQICNSPKLLSDEEDYGDSSAKMKVLIEEIESKSKYHKILVFSQFVGMLDLIRAELDKLKISHQYLTGQTTNREEIVHSFQNDADIRVFLISLKAGGTGLNLTEADYVFLVDPWWNPAVENQAIDRCYRIGQQKNVVAIRLITPGTIEEKIMLLQVNKRELAEDIIQTDQNILKSLSQEDLLGLFS